MAEQYAVEEQQQFQPYQQQQQEYQQDHQAHGLNLDEAPIEEDTALAQWTPIKYLLEGDRKLAQNDIDKLIQMGINTVEQSLHFPDRALAAGGLTEGKIKILRQRCDEISPSTFVTGQDLLDARRNMSLISTGSERFNSLLGGGLEPAAITELYGEFNSGKTQLCLTACVTTQLPRHFGGSAGRVLYIDTEGTFRPERILEIAETRGLPADQVLENIQVARALNSDHQRDLLKKCAELMAVDRYSLIVVDSVTALFRTDYTGRGTLADRQVALGKFLRELHGLAHTFNVAALITNQVVSDIAQAAQMGGGDNKKPIGGNILAHASTTRIQLRKGRAGTKVGRVIDSPHLPEGECSFVINNRGIDDAEDE